MKYLFAPLLLLPVLLLTLFPSAPADVSADDPIVKPFEAPDDIPGESFAVLELFTSQGCSSCPSADALLSELDAGDDRVLALSFHVDYWNYLGWKDPFSSAVFSARQSDYTDALRERTYTPQLVVNGSEALIGSRRGEVTAAVAKALKQTDFVVPALTTTREGNRVSVSYDLGGVATEGLRVSALLVQPSAESSVSRGENRGRKLHHVNVVRDLAQAPAQATGTLTLTAPDNLDAAAAEVVLLLEDASTYAVVGAARD